MNTFTMDWVADALRAAGLEVWELQGWRTWEPGYAWRKTPAGLYEPEGHMVHHTATTAYTPNVHDGNGRTKANAWLGLRREGRLYFSGGGVPTVALSAAGPANYSSGSGVQSVLTRYVREDLQFEGPQKSPDDEPKWYANRSYWNTEVVHPGYGEPLDSGVWDLLIAYSAVLCMELGWSAYRTIAHEDSTRRKVDPRFMQGAPYTIGQIQDEVTWYMNVGDEGMETARWASRLRVHDINHYAEIGILAPDEVAYWSGKVEEGHSSGNWADPEWNDLRDAALVRGPIWGYPGQV